jgi:sec-independent protein translocase protein TatB
MGDILGLGIGLPQLLLVLIVAMIVLGPERLPEVARQMARGVRTLRNYATDVQSQFGGELDEIREELLGIQRDLSEVTGSLRGGLNEVDQSIRSVHADMNGAIGSALNGTEATSAYESAGSAAPAGPPEFKPETPVSVRSSLYRAAPLASSSISPPFDSGAADPRLPDYRPPA